MSVDLSQFDPVLDEVTVGALRLSVARPRSAEDLIDEDDYARDERLPYWAELWPSALVLADHLAGLPLAGRGVVELGCGVGVPSIVAALAGARVLASDWYEEALAFTRANAGAAGAHVDTLHVDWNDPPAALLARPPADLVIGADLLYEPRNGAALAALLPRIVAPGADLLIADPRRPHVDALVDPLTTAGWSHRVQEIRYGGRPDESGRLIHLHRLGAPGG